MACSTFWGALGVYGHWALGMGMDLGGLRRKGWELHSMIPLGILHSGTYYGYDGPHVAANDSSAYLLGSRFSLMIETDILQAGIIHLSFVKDLDSDLHLHHLLFSYVRRR